MAPEKSETSRKRRFGVWNNSHQPASSDTSTKTSAQSEIGKFGVTPLGKSSNNEFLSSENLTRNCSAGMFVGFSDPSFVGKGVGTVLGDIVGFCEGFFDG